ncbi:hypothetical protein BH24ACT26_BH24ACT26_19050 [soil metagenome]
MGWQSSGYRPAHTAHGSLYWRLFMWPLALGRALLQVRHGAVIESPSPASDVAASDAPRPRLVPPPPPPPPGHGGPPKLWRLHEGQVKPQWLEQDLRAGARTRLGIARRRSSSL